MLRFKRFYYRYSLKEGARAHPNRAWAETRSVLRSASFISMAAVIVGMCLTHASLYDPRNVSADTSTVPGESYEICNDTSQYLTSPWTYDGVSQSQGQQTFSVSAYQALPGYGTTLPPLPSYILNESSSTEAAEIFAPGSTAVSNPAYDFPQTPIMYFFEGGAYGQIGLESVSDDEFIGGSANGYPEPEFDDGGNADGIDSGNGSFYYQGGGGTLLSTANAGATSVTTSSTIPGYLQYVTFADGSTYEIASYSNNVMTLTSPLTASESAGSVVYANVTQPIAYVAGATSQGGSSVTFTSSSIPLMQYSNVVIGTDNYQLTSATGSESGYTVGVGKLDYAVAANTPVYDNIPAGDVTVEYLNINDDQHITTGTIYTGSGWTIEHNDIHDGYSQGPGYGVALYGGDEGTIEYNCLSKMGDYGINATGANNTFDYNEIYESNYEADPGCGCSGGGKWWGTLNANIVDNAFIGDGYGGGGAVWLDNGNSGTLIQGNYFDQTYANDISSETGFDLDVTDNLFEDGGWGNGTGACGGNNCGGAVNVNSSGGSNVPGSRYENEINVSDNQFFNEWDGLDIWQSGERSCQNSGEGWPMDAAYCSGGFPNTATTASDGQYYFSHIGDSLNGSTTTTAQSASSGSSTVLVQGAEAIDDQIGFDNTSSTTTASTVNATTFAGSSTLTVTSTSGFPSSGQLLVGTSYGDAVLTYTGTTATTFTGVSFVNDPEVASSGTLNGSVKVNTPAYATTSDTTDASTLTGSGTVHVATTAGFPTSGKLRVGTSEAWSDGGGSFTCAILSYTGTTATSFTGVSLVSGEGTLAGSILQVQPYKVTAETCYANDCALTVSPALSATAAAGTEVSNAGTCQLYATATALPSGPMAPNSAGSYFDGCQWEVKDVSVTGNNFTSQPSVMNNTPPLNGGTTQCTEANFCGINFMAYQVGGEAPFNTQIGANALMSSSSFTTCPSWDSGCTSDPLNNLNALSSPPGVPAGNDEASGNNVWSDNTYSGPWSWTDNIFGNCSGGGIYMPEDPTTGKSLTAASCNTNFSQWQSDWQQDAGSSYDPMVVSLSGLSPDQNLHGTSQTVTAYEDAQNGDTINSTLSVGSSIASTVSDLSNSPHNFTLNTTSYSDGLYALKVAGTDSSGNTDYDSVPVYIDNGDLNGDGKVSISDLAIMAAHWGQTDSNYADGNISGQGTINISDLAILAANWGWNE